EEAALLIRSAWRYRDKRTGRFTRRHVAKFALVGLYTGRRAAAICEARLERGDDHGWIDLKRGVFHPHPKRRKTKKSQPTIRLPNRLLAHLRRWHRAGQKFVVEWNGVPIGRMNHAFRDAARDVGFKDVSPHTLRHTAATWGMQRGADRWQLAGYLGM